MIEETGMFLSFFTSATFFLILSFGIFTTAFFSLTSEKLVEILSANVFLIQNYLLDIISNTPIYSFCFLDM